MTDSTTKFWRVVWRSAFGLWLVLIVGHAFYVFVFPAPSNYGPEIGPTATFVFFAAMFSAAYLGVFIFVVVPVLILLRLLLPSSRTDDPPA